VVVVTQWFARLDLSLASDAQKRVVQGVGHLLDQLQPERLDPADQVVEPEDGETWVRLRHNSEPYLEIRFVLSDGWVNFYGVMGHDEAYSVHPEPGDSWESETIDILADLLQSQYTLDSYEMRGKPWRTMITVSAPYDRQSYKLESKAAVLPLSRWAARTDSRPASFGCRGARPPAG
jgi:hypothetical protein